MAGRGLVPVKDGAKGGLIDGGAVERAKGGNRARPPWLFAEDVKERRVDLGGQGKRGGAIAGEVGQTFEGAVSELGPVGERPAVTPNWCCFIKGAGNPPEVVRAEREGGEIGLDGSIDSELPHEHDKPGSVLSGGSSPFGQPHL